MQTEVYSAREIARAAGVPEAEVAALLSRPGAPVVLHGFVRHTDAVRIGRALAKNARTPFATSAEERDGRRVIAPLAVSSTIHAAGIAIALFVATLDLAPRAQAMVEQRAPDPMRLVFLATPGPGGGGGGGGLQQKPAPPKAMREGRSKLSSPMPRREEPKPVAPPTPKPPEPKPPPPLASEQLPVVVAPIVNAPADARSRAGVLEETAAQNDSRGPGLGGGVGTGSGSGLGSGEGSGVGPGSGGGTGGGPYRPGSGIEPPRIVREVRADYTEDARRQGIRGDVVLEIVVRSDGTVGDVRILQGLGGGLNERAVQAVRQWKFAPATRRGAPVDVVVEVAVEFRLR